MAAGGLVYCAFRDNIFSVCKENKEDLSTAVPSDPNLTVYASSAVSSLNGITGDIYDIIKDIKDPERPCTLEELKVVEEDKVNVNMTRHCVMITIEFTPTVPHCSLATLIGLCMRVKLERCLPELERFKLNLYISKGAHSTEEDINKQINDKERIIAAMENPNLKEIVEECIKETDY